MKLLLLLIPFLIACNDTTDLAAQEAEKKVIDKLKTEVLTLVDSSVCSSEYSCHFVGFGSKPCGGHWAYLVYSNSIDTVELLNKIEKYNTLQKEFNIKWGLMSDCSVVSPPDYVICEDGKCKAVYSN